MQPTSTVRGNLGTCSLSPSQRRPPRGACVSESYWSPAPRSLRAPIGRRFSPGEDQRGGGWSQAGALELRMTGVPGPQATVCRLVSAALPGSCRGHCREGSWGSQGERQLHCAWKSLGGREEGDCVHPDEVRGEGALPCRGSAGPET